MAVRYTSRFLMGFSVVVAGLLQTSSGQESTSRVSVTAIPLPSPVTLDGILSEEIWRTESFSAFMQRDPDQGKNPSERSEVWVAYDNEAIYVAAKLFDHAPDSIIQVLGRRDAFVTADRFTVYLDPYNDGRSGYFFAVGASGAVQDGTLYNDDWNDDSWDGVWESEARVLNDGWALEMRIPFSQLRFHDKPEHVWGINFKREIGRRNELDYLAYTPRNESGFVSRFGSLVGIRSVGSARQFELLPYVNTKAEYIQPQTGDPFNSGSRFIPGFGADVKVGLTSNLTLDGTVNPDFGQVEVDPAVVNLSDVETYFSEKRPFFIEGANVFEFGYGGSNNFYGFNWGSPTIFYSRRIGRPPQGSLPSFDYADKPVGTHILGAGKLTGRILDDWKMGMVHAVTRREFARISVNGAHSDVEIEPLTYYGITRFQRDYDGGRQGLGFMGTVAQRSFDDAGLEGEFNSGSYVGGLDGWTFLDEDKTYVLTGWGIVTHVRGSQARLLALQTHPTHYFQRPDASALSVDSSATSLTGFGGRILLNKQKGPMILNASLGVLDPSMDVNDLGFFWRNNMINSHFVLGYKWSDPTDWYRSARVQASVFATFDFDGNKSWHGYWMNNFIQFPNYWGLYGGIAVNPTTYDNRRTRGGPVMQIPPGYEIFAGLESDSRKSIVFYLEGFTYQRANEPSWSINPYIEWKPRPNISVSIGPSFGRDRTQAQYVTTVQDPGATATYGNRYVFAVIDQTSLSANIRLNWTFTPKLSLQLFLQPLIASGDYHSFKEFSRPRTYEFLEYGTGSSTKTDSLKPDGTVHSYTFDPDGSGPGVPFVLENPDFNFTSLRGNAVLRWEYLPGSTLYLVWTRSSTGSMPDGDFRFNRSIDRLFQGPADDIFMLKFSYWLSM